METPAAGVFGKTEPSGEEFLRPGIPRGRRFRFELSRGFPRLGEPLVPPAFSFQLSAVLGGTWYLVRLLSSSRNLCSGREILVGCGFALGWVVGICSLLAASEETLRRRRPGRAIWVTERFGWGVHFGGSCKGEAAREGCTSRDTFGLIGRPAGVLVFPSGETWFLGNERPCPRERVAPLGNKGLSVGNVGSPSKGGAPS